MQILVIGKGAKEYTLAKKIKEQRPEDIIFVAPGNQAITDFATCIDIQPNNANELIDFALANEINLTIISDESAIDAGVTDAFNETGLMVFGPDKDSARFATSKAISKRFMYKLQIPTPKFGIFDKENAARTYIKSASYPILIKTDKHQDGENVYLCHSLREATNILNKLYAIEEPKIVIENYIAGREFSFYVATDGYNAVPICAVVPYKYASEKDGGSITKGVGAYAPAVFIDDALTRKILQKIIYPALSEAEKNSTPYTGILGADIIIDDYNNLSTIEFNTFFKEPDIECITNLIEDDIIDIFKACTVGSLADDYEYIKLKDKSAISIVLTKIPHHLFDNEQSTLFDLDKLDDDIGITLYNTIDKNNKILVKAGRALSLTATASTLGRAKKKLRDNIDLINFNGKKFRKDIIEQEYVR